MVKYFHCSCALLASVLLGCGTGAANSETLPTSSEPPGGSTTTTTATITSTSGMPSTESGPTTGLTTDSIDSGSASLTDANTATSSNLTTSTTGDGTFSSGAPEPGSSGGESSSTTGTTEKGCENGKVEEGEECDDNTPGCNNCFLDRRVFVTSIRYAGDMSYTEQVGPAEGNGVERADYRCTNLAGSAGLDNSENYLAWLSGSEVETQSARFNTDFAGRYVAKKGETETVVIANGWAGLVQGTLENPISYDEHGDKVEAYPFVWTNTMTNGDRASNDHCVDWSKTEGVSRIGAAKSNDASWTYVTDTNASRKCADVARLYCFEDLP